MFPGLNWRSALQSEGQEKRRHLPADHADGRRYPLLWPICVNLRDLRDLRATPDSVAAGRPGQRSGLGAWGCGGSTGASPCQGAVLGVRRSGQVGRVTPCAPLFVFACGGGQRIGRPASPAFTDVLRIGNAPAHAFVSSLDILGLHANFYRVRARTCRCGRRQDHRRMGQKGRLGQSAAERSEGEEDNTFARRSRRWTQMLAPSFANLRQSSGNSGFGRGFAALCLLCLFAAIRNPQSAFASRLRRDKSATCRAEAMRRRVRNAAGLITRSIRLPYLMVPTLESGFIGRLFGLFGVNRCNYPAMNILHKNGRFFNEG